MVGWSSAPHAVGRRLCLRRCRRALLVFSCLVPCILFCTGATVLWPAANTSNASCRPGARPAAAILPPLAPDDAAAVSAVATFVQWGFPAAPSANAQPSLTRPYNVAEKMQIVGLLPAVGRSRPGGAWAPTTWHGRPRPTSRRSTSEPFAVRLVQPNIYGVYKYLIESRRVELKQQEKKLKGGRKAVVYELRPVSIWRRFLNNLL